MTWFDVQIDIPQPSVGHRRIHPTSRVFEELRIRGTDQLSGEDHVAFLKWIGKVRFGVISSRILTFFSAVPSRRTLKRTSEKSENAKNVIPVEF